MSVSASTEQNTLWKQDEPCYSKVAHSAVVALCLSSKSKGSLSISHQMAWLHRLHMKLDAVVVAHGATKFSGSDESYLVVKTAESRLEAARAMKEIGEKLVKAGTEVCTVRAILGHGEIGFGVLGSTGWNYQFYGGLIEDLKEEVKNCTPGRLHVMKDVLKFLNDEGSSTGPTCYEQRSSDLAGPPTAADSNEYIPATFNEWRGRNLQQVDLWVLLITLLLSILSVIGVLEKAGNHEQVPLVPFIFQMQCLALSVYVLGVWTMNRGYFIQKHNMFMAIVWVSQSMNRLISSLLMPLPLDRMLNLHPILRILAANGPEKLLLTSVPLVNGTWLVLLHAFSAFSAVLFGIRTCSEIAEATGQVPSNCQPSAMVMNAMVNTIVSFVFPVMYGLFLNRSARRQYERLSSTKGNKQL